MMTLGPVKRKGRRKGYEMGRCFEGAQDASFFWHERGLETYVVHAFQSLCPQAGKCKSFWRYHCWCEVDSDGEVFVYDLTLYDEPIKKVKYYKMMGVHPRFVFRYGFEQYLKLSLEFGHLGPFEEAFFRITGGDKTLRCTAKELERRHDSPEGQKRFEKYAGALKKK